MLIHAAGESANGVTPGTFAVALTAKDEHALKQVEEKLRWAEIPYSAFHEPDPPWSGALMSIGINPVQDRRMLRRFLKGLSLLGAKDDRPKE